MQFDHNRRDFVTLLGGVAVAWPLTARAQQPEQMRRIGVLTNLAAEDPEGRTRIEALLQGLSELGWREGRTLKIDIRWGVDDAETSRTQASELLALAPDVIFATTTSKVQVLRRVTRSVPIVFAGVSDPVGGGLVATLARPGGNITGFALPEYGISVKWLELLKEIAPRVARVGVLSGFGTTPGIGQLAALQAVAPSMRVDLTPLVVGGADEIEATVRAFSSAPNRGLIITTGTVLQANRELIIALAARYGLPAVYPFRLYVNDGGLLFYGADIIDLFRRAAGYVDRILKGEKPADLPVQAPTKYELVINLKTARALGLEVPATLLARADEVIE
jgi:putative ABC transport system substrate-binding protein